VWISGNHYPDSYQDRKMRRQRSARIKTGHYHTLPQAAGNLYQAVRKQLGLTRSAMATLLGLQDEQLRYRERFKRMYHPCEVAALQQASGMTWDEFGKLLNDIA
jgi:hypothetical protein